MNKNDIEVLKINWELMKEKAKICQYKFDLDISSSCYVEFGNDCM